MARTCTHPRRVVVDLDLTGLRPWVSRAVAARINCGDLDISDAWSMPEVVTDLVADLVTQQTVVLRERLDATAAELDAANDAVTELVAQLEAAHAETGTGVEGGGRR